MKPTRLSRKHARWIAPVLALTFMGISGSAAEAGSPDNSHPQKQTTDPVGKSEGSVADSPAFQLSLIVEPRSGEHLLGARTWDQPSLRIGPQIVLFERFYLRGPHFFYEHFRRNEPYEWDIGVQLYQDTPMVSLGSREEDFRNQRDSALETYTQFKYKFGLRQLFYFGSKASHGLGVGHSSPYGELLAGMPVLPYTILNGAIGAGTTAFNRYYYGNGATAGLNNARLNLKLYIPSVPWNGVLILGSEATWVLQTENQEADYVRGDHFNLTGSLAMIWNIL